MYQKVNYGSLETGSRRRRVVSNSADVFHNVGLGFKYNESRVGLLGDVINDRLAG